MVPLATLLGWAAALWGGALALRRLAPPGGPTTRFLARALAAGLAAGALSAPARASRAAGTGTYTTWGWPRPIYTRWVAWELPAGAPGARQGGPRLRGLLENAIFYGGAAAALGAAAGAGRARSGRRRPREPVA